MSTRVTATEERHVLRRWVATGPIIVGPENLLLTGKVLIWTNHIYAG